MSGDGAQVRWNLGQRGVRLRLIAPDCHHQRSAGGHLLPLHLGAKKGSKDKASEMFNNRRCFGAFLRRKESCASKRNDENEEQGCEQTDDCGKYCLRKAERRLEHRNSSRVSGRYKDAGDLDVRESRHELPSNPAQGKQYRKKGESSSF